MLLRGLISDFIYCIVNRSLFTYGMWDKWYARCGYNADQVYNERGKYVGYDRRLTVMFPYVCEVSPLSRSPRPQPR